MYILIYVLSGQHAIFMKLEVSKLPYLRAHQMFLQDNISIVLNCQRSLNITTIQL